MPKVSRYDEKSLYCSLYAVNISGNGPRLPNKKITFFLVRLLFIYFFLICVRIFIVQFFQQNNVDALCDLASISSFNL